MGFSLDISVPVFTVFLQGLLSFFSPCVLPLIPLYIGYLSGGTRTVGEDGKVYYKRRKVMINTLFFVLGISFTFFLLGLGVSALGTFFNKNQLMFARTGGILVVIFGLYQLGVFGKSEILGKERRLPFRLNALAMSPVMALIMGFTFSFAWTPCVGPALASVLLMAASASTKMMAFGLIGVYTLGFVLPFLAVGLFTSTLLDVFRKHGKVVQYTVKVGGILMILMGVMMFTGKMNAITGYLSSVTSVSQEKTDSEKTDNGAKENKTQDNENEDAKTEGTQDQADKENTDPESPGDSRKDDTDNKTAGQSGDDGQTKDGENKDGQDNGDSSAQGGQEGKAEELPDIIDFTLTDQYGNTHTLSEYKGKTVFLNFWATWCPPCRAEMPDIQKLYDEYAEKGDDSVVILGIAAPDYGQEKSQEKIQQFLEDNGYTYPVVMDPGGEIFMQYGIYSFPTTYMITTEGKVFGYASGQLNEEMMRSIIEQTIEGKRK